MINSDAKRDLLVMIDGLLADALALADQADEYALGAHIAEALSRVAESVSRLA